MGTFVSVSRKSTDPLSRIALALCGWLRRIFLNHEIVIWILTRCNNVPLPTTKSSTEWIGDLLPTPPEVDISFQQADTERGAI